MNKRIAVEEGSGLVFADIGLPTHILQIDQPKILRLLRGQLSGFSRERLMRFLTMLGRDVEIIVKRPPRSRRQGRIRVLATA